MQIDVSVVTPTFHRERELLLAIQSALQQTAVSVEVLVVDDSPDGSASAHVLALGDARVRYERMAQPSGGRPALVRNQGAGNARGRFLHFLDDDDRLANGALAALVGALERSPCAGVAAGVVVPFGEDSKVLSRERAYFERASSVARKRIGKFDMVACMLFQNPPFVNSACMVRREHFFALGGYDPLISYCEDNEFFMRAIRAYGHVFVDRPVVYYRTGAPSLMHNLENTGPVIESYRRICAKYRLEHGTLEFLGLKALGKALLAIEG